MKDSLTIQPELSPEDIVFIENFIKQIKRPKGSGRPAFIERNNNIIRWHYYGYGVGQIQSLIENPPTPTRIYGIIIRETRDRVPSLLSDEYYRRREININKLLVKGDENGERN